MLFFPLIFAANTTTIIVHTELLAACVLPVQEEAEEQNFPQNANVMNHHQPPPPLKLPEQHKNYMWWLRMAVYSFLVLSTQAVATLLGRLYFAKGGSGKWTATLVQICGFPILLPFLLFSPNTPQKRENNRPNAPSSVTLASLYLCLGVLLAANCMLYSIGLLYLPVSTYSLICATQLGFNALFSYFLNSQKITPFIINSLVVLTISSTLLVFQNDSSGSNKVSKGKYAIGFCVGWIRVVALRDSTSLQENTKTRKFSGRFEYDNLPIPRRNNSDFGGAFW